MSSAVNWVCSAAGKCVELGKKVAGPIGTVGSIAAQAANIRTEQNLLESDVKHAVLVHNLLKRQYEYLSSIIRELNLNADFLADIRGFLHHLHDFIRNTIQGSGILDRAYTKAFPKWYRSELGNLILYANNFASSMSSIAATIRREIKEDGQINKALEALLHNY